MKESGAWLVPTYNGAVYLDKPALFFKTVALSLAAFGNSEASARIPSAVAAVVLSLLVFLFCRRIYGQRCALLAVIVIATTPLFVAYARTVIFDMMLALFVCAAIFAGYLAELREGAARHNWYLAGAGCAGVATLVKGPIGFLIPLLVLLVFNLLDGRRGAWKRLLSPLNLLIFFGVALAWFIPLCCRHPNFLQYGLVEESFKRFTSAKRFHRSEPFFFYLPIVAATFVPWSFLLPEAIWATWKNRWVKNSADRLCLVWALLVVVFFSISQSKLPAYILSVTVALGILVARIFDSAMNLPQGGAAAIVRRATAALGWLCLAAVPIGFIAAISQARALADLLRISVSEASGLFASAVPLIVSVVLFAGIGIFAAHRRSMPLCFLCLAISMQAFGHSSFSAFSVVYEAKSARRLAKELATLPPDTELVLIECFPTGLPFYLGRTLTLCSRDCDELTSNYIVYCTEKLGKWPEKAVPLSQLDQWISSRRRAVCLVTTAERRWELTPIADAHGTKVQPLAPGYVAVKLPCKEAR